VGVPGNVPATKYVSFNNSARWQLVRPNWDQYSITGVKIEWMPTQRYPDSTDPYLQAVWTCNTPDQYDNISLAQDNSIAASPGFKAISTRSGWKKWISCKKLSKQENVSW